MVTANIKNVAITSLALFGVWYLASQTLLGMKLQEYLKPTFVLEAESGGGAMFGASSAYAYIHKR